VTTPVLGDVSALVRGWMHDESVEAVFASYDGAELDVAAVE
jgi:hypothetical protein